MARTSQATHAEPSDANPSVAYSLKAETVCRQQRHELARQMLRISPGVTGQDKLIADRVMDAVRIGASNFDRALASPEVDDLFRRGVLRFGEANHHISLDPSTLPRPDGVA